MLCKRQDKLHCTCPLLHEQAQNKWAGCFVHCHLSPPLQTPVGQTPVAVTQIAAKEPETIISDRPERRKVPKIADEPDFLERLHRVEKHIRKNNLRATFTDQIGKAGALDEVASLNEAHQLAFFLFWNIKPSFDR